MESIPFDGCLNDRYILLDEKDVTQGLLRKSMVEQGNKGQDKRMFNLNARYLQRPKPTRGVYEDKVAPRNSCVIIELEQYI